MKTITSFILFCFSFIPLFAATPFFDDDDEEVIIIVETTEGTTPGFRGSSIIPIEAVFSLLDNTVSIQFALNIGEVSIRLANLSTGAIQTTIVDSSYGGCSLPIMDSTGPYRIDFHTCYGSDYFGFFLVE